MRRAKKNKKNKTPKCHAPSSLLARAVALFLNPCWVPRLWKVLCADERENRREKLRKTAHEARGEDAFFFFFCNGGSEKLDSLENANANEEKKTRPLPLFSSSLSLPHRHNNNTKSKPTVLRPVLPGNPPSELHSLLRHGLHRHVGPGGPLPGSFLHQPRPVLPFEVLDLQAAPRALQDGLRHRSSHGILCGRDHDPGLSPDLDPKTALRDRS